MFDTNIYIVLSLQQLYHRQHIYLLSSTATAKLRIYLKPEKHNQNYREDLHHICII